MDPQSFIADPDPDPDPAVFLIEDPDPDMDPDPDTAPDPVADPAPAFLYKIALKFVFQCGIQTDSDSQNTSFENIRVLAHM